MIVLYFECAFECIRLSRRVPIDTTRYLLMWFEVVSDIDNIVVLKSQVVLRCSRYSCVEIWFVCYDDISTTTECGVCASGFRNGSIVGRRINGRSPTVIIILILGFSVGAWWFWWNTRLTRSWSSRFPVLSSSADYRPELDDTALLEPDMISRYQQLIGILRWACDLGRLDILLEVALLRSFSAAPRQGHYDQVYNIFSYIKVHR